MNGNDFVSFGCVLFTRSDQWALHLELIFKEVWTEVHEHIYDDLSLSLSVTDAFVNSQEWTLSRSVPELKVVSPVTDV